MALLSKRHMRLLHKEFEFDLIESGDVDDGAVREVKGALGRDPEGREGTILY